MSNVVDRQAIDGRVLIALGSHGRGDDGVGLRIAESLSSHSFRVVCGQDDCMGIINAWDGASLAVVVDAACSGAAPGTIHRLELGTAPLPRDLARCSSHGTGLAEAVELAKVIDRLPSRLVIYAIEAASFSPGDAITPAVLASVANVSRRIAAELES